MEAETKDWIVKWFKERNPGITIDSTVDFYKARLVDSFGIIELIEELEDYFSIHFDDSDFKLPSFRTIQGLAQMINQKISSLNRQKS